MYSGKDVSASTNQGVFYTSFVGTLLLATILVLTDIFLSQKEGNDIQIGKYPVLYHFYFRETLYIIIVQCKLILRSSLLNKEVIFEMFVLI